LRRSFPSPAVWLCGARPSSDLLVGVRGSSERSGAVRLFLLWIARRRIQLWILKLLLVGSEVLLME
jgi:hypothetical protein